MFHATQVLHPILGEMMRLENMKMRSEKRKKTHKTVNTTLLKCYMVLIMFRIQYIHVRTPASHVHIECSVQRPIYVREFWLKFS